jgi:hypothetical protein
MARRFLLIGIGLGSIDTRRLQAEASLLGCCRCGYIGGCVVRPLCRDAAPIGEPEGALIAAFVRSLLPQVCVSPSDFSRPAECVSETWLHQTKGRR